MSHSLIESLEDRRLFKAPPTVTAVFADNRGQAEITLSRNVKFGVNPVLVFTAGADDELGTADDVAVSDVTFQFVAKKFRMVVNTNTALGEAYRIRLRSERIFAVNAGGDPVTGRKFLDGEFDMALPSGNGESGGDFRFSANSQTNARPVVRIATSLGNINVRLRPDLAPSSVDNFLSYMNSNRYDNTFFSRSADEFVLQGGGARVVENEDKKLRVVQDVLDSGIGTEPQLLGNRNVLGTLAFARSGPNNLATNQFFFNLADNPVLDEPGDQNTFYTPFAQPVGTADVNVITTIGQQQRRDLSDDISIEIPGGFDQVPQATSDPSLPALENIVMIRRVSQRMDLTFGG